MGQRLEMFENYDETDLLALIEDELDEAAANDLRARLAAEPRLLAMIERMRADRARLQADDDPVLPGDLLVALEPMLARPMLMPDLSALRRKRSRRPRVLAAAAAVVVIGGAGVWATIVTVVARSAPATSDRLAGGEAASTPSGAEPSPALTLTRADDEPWPPQDTVIHHRAPAIGPAIRHMDRDAGESEPALASRDPVLVAADFMLVVRSRDATGVEEILQRVLSDLGTDAAFVRNFSYDEADELEETLRLAEGRRTAPDTADIGETVAGGAGNQGGLDNRRRERGRRMLPRRGAPAEAKLSPSTVLWGAPRLAPSFERQLDFSEWGAEYTICVPAARLAQVLARLELTEGQATVLQVQAGEPDTVEDAEASSDEARWLWEYPLVRQASEALRREGRNAVILLPVVVEERD
jgi:hypothetical protein